MPKRSADTQLTKDDMNNGFTFGAGGGAEDAAGSVPMASHDTMAKRKIAPLKRRGGRGGAMTPGRTTPGASIPNVFAGIGGNVSFGAGAGTNGAASPNPAGFGFGAQPAGPTTPTGFGAGTSGFNFGQQQQQPEQPKPNPFGGLAPQPAATNGSSGGFTFGGNSATPAPAVNGLFGNNATATASFGGFGSNAPAAEAPKPPSSSFTFGAAPSAPAAAPSGNLFGGMSNDGPKPFTFGMPAEKKAEGPKPTPSFTFGAATTAAPTSSPTPASASMFGFNSTNNAPAPATTDSSTPFQFGAASSNAGSSLFGKPAESKPAEVGAGSSLFGKPADSSLFGKPAATEPAGGSSLFGKPTTTEPAAGSSLFGKPSTSESAPLSGSLFGKPAEAPASNSSLFGKPSEQTPAPAFGGFQFGNKGKEAEKADAPAPTGFLFGTQSAAEKKEEPPKASLFGSASITSGASSSLFGNPPAQTGSLFGNAPEKAVEQPSAPAFEFKPDAEKASPVPLAPLFGGFGAQKTAPTPPPPTFSPPAPVAPSPLPFFAPPQQKESSPPTSSALVKSVSPEPWRQSPPPPPGSSQWTVNQLTEYYNLFALRSLNHFFKDEISKADIFADLGPLCEAYQKEAANIRDLMASNQRYKFGEASGTTGSSIPSKRGMDDSEERSGKRRAPGEEPKKIGFASSTSKSSSSQALASILGGGNGSSSSQKLAEKPAFGFRPPTEAPKSDGGFLAAKPAFGFKPPTSAPIQDKPKETGSPRSIFDSPSPAASASPSGWICPFAPVDTSNLPDDNFAEEDDDESTTKSSTNGTSGGSLFDRISPPKDLITTPSKPLFGGDQTWTPDKGFKFSTSAAPTSNLFGTNPSSGSSLFGNNNNLNLPSTFGSTAASSAVSSSKPSPAPTTPDDATNEPSNDVPQASDVLPGCGPGEEGEERLFEARASIWDSTSGDRKIGAGQVRVLKHKETGKSRILARKDLGAVLLNVAIVEGVEYVIRGGKAVLIPEFLANGVKKTWMIRLGKPETAEALKKALTTAV